MAVGIYTDMKNTGNDNYISKSIAFNIFEDYLIV